MRSPQLAAAAALWLLLAEFYLVEEQDEVDGEGDEERQEPEVVEVPSQVVLWNQTASFKFLHMFLLSPAALAHLQLREMSDQYFGLVDFQAGEEGGHEGLGRVLLLSQALLRRFLLLHRGALGSLVFRPRVVVLFPVLRAATTCLNGGPDICVSE